MMRSTITQQEAKQQHTTQNTAQKARATLRWQHTKHDMMQTLSTNTDRRVDMGTRDCVHSASSALGFQKAQHTACLRKAAGPPAQD